MFIHLFVLTRVKRKPNWKKEMQNQNATSSSPSDSPGTSFRTFFLTVRLFAQKPMTASELCSHDCGCIKHLLVSSWVVSSFMVGRTRLSVSWLSLCRNSDITGTLVTFPDHYVVSKCPYILWYWTVHCMVKKCESLKEQIRSLDKQVTEITVKTTTARIQPSPHLVQDEGIVTIPSKSERNPIHQDSIIRDILSIQFLWYISKLHQRCEGNCMAELQDMGVSKFSPIIIHWYKQLHDCWAFDNWIQRLLKSYVWSKQASPLHIEDSISSSPQSWQGGSIEAC